MARSREPVNASMLSGDELVAAIESSWASGDVEGPCQLVTWDRKQSGDRGLFSYPVARGPHHVAIYVGGDRVLHAPRTDDVVRYGAIGEVQVRS